MRSARLLIVFLFATLYTVGQESYTVKMQIHIEGLPAEYAAFGEQDITSYIKGEKGKTEISSALYHSVIYFDKDSMTVINEGLGNRSGFVASKAELEASSDKSETSKPKIDYTQEKKTIAGYPCTKAIITPTSDKSPYTRIIVWATEKIKADPSARRANRGMQDLGDLKGFPLEMEVETQSQGKEVKVIMITEEVVTTEIPDSAFEPDTDGAKILPYKEWQEQLKNSKAK